MVEILRLWSKQIKKNLKEEFLQPNDSSTQTRGCQFNQHFYKQLLHQYSCAKKVQTKILSTKKLLVLLLFKKASHKMLVKLTPDGG
jgi:hypothetical protein